MEESLCFVASFWQRAFSLIWVAESVWHAEKTGKGNLEDGGYHGLPFAASIEVLLGAFVPCVWVCKPSFVSI